MDKEKYISPEMEIIRFECEDMVVTSLCTENETPIVGQAANSRGMFFDESDGMWHTYDE